MCLVILQPWQQTTKKPETTVNPEGLEQNSVTYRQSLGTEDNSGDVTAYEKEISVTIDGCSVTLKGDGQQFFLAVWSDGTYSYSIVDKAHGLFRIPRRNGIHFVRVSLAWYERVLLLSARMCYRLRKSKPNIA